MLHEPHVCSEALLAVARLCAACAALRVPYAVRGDFAIALYGAGACQPAHADVVIDLRAQHAQPFARLIAAEFDCDRGAIDEAVNERSVFELRHRVTPARITVLVPEPDASVVDELAYARKERVDVAGAQHEIRLSSPEDLVVCGLVACRQGGTDAERHYASVRALIGTQRDQLDRAFLEASAKRTGVGELLNKALG